MKNYQTNISSETITSIIKAKYGAKESPLIEASLRRKVLNAQITAYKAKRTHVKIDPNAAIFRYLTSPDPSSIAIFNTGVFSVKNYTIARLKNFAEKHEEVAKILEELKQGKIHSSTAIQKVKEYKERLRREDETNYRAGSL